MLDSVIDLTFGRPAQHVVVAGGFGSGKSYALGRATEVAAKGGLRVAALARGPLGISSYADFLVAVARATRPRGRSRDDVDLWRRELSDDGNDLNLDELERRALGAPGDAGLVIVVESMDQLLHQVRSTDRPRLVDLLTAGPSNLLVLGSVHGNGLAAELG